jgi:hypothetical protein
MLFEEIQQPSNGTSSATWSSLLNSSKAWCTAMEDRRMKASSSTAADWHCSEGYKGNLCGVCTKGYGMARMFTCNKCLPSGVIAVLYVLSAIVMIIAVRIMAGFTLDDNRITNAPDEVTPILSTVSSTATCDVGASSNWTTATSVGPQQIDEPYCMDSKASANTRDLPTESDVPTGRLQRILYFVVLMEPRDLTPWDVCKTLVVYLQYLLLVSKLRIQWPVTLSYPFTALAWIWSTSSSEVLALDCALRVASSDAGSKVPIPIQRMLVYVFVPVVLLLVLLLLEPLLTLLTPKLCRWYARLKELFTCMDDPESSSSSTLTVPHAASAMETSEEGNVQASLGLRCGVIAMVALFVSLPTVIGALLSMFMCINIDEEGYIPYGCTAAAIGSFWAYDLDQSCWKGYHKVWAFGFALPLSVLTCVVLPVGLAWFLMHNRSKLQNATFQERFGFLYRNYEPRCCAWESVSIAQTVALVCITVFGYTMGSYHQALVMNAVLALVLVLQMLYRPYRSQALHYLRVASCCCLLLTTYAAMSFFSFSTRVVVPEAYKLAMGAVVMVINLGFVLYALFLVVKAVNWQGVKASYTTIVDFLKGCTRCCGGG